MKKLVFDSDGLIKLVKSEVFNKIKHSCFISEEVYKETVTAGKEGFYTDAQEIEQFVMQKRIKVRMVDIKEDVYGLGKGEQSALALFRVIKADALVSDDRRFLTFLDEQNIPFLLPSEVIVALALRKYITKEEGIEALNKIRKLIRNQNYESALFALGGQK